LALTASPADRMFFATLSRSTSPPHPRLDGNRFILVTSDRMRQHHVGSIIPDEACAVD
jgi:hypothetical protein